MTNSAPAGESCSSSRSEEEGFGPVVLSDEHRNVAAVVTEKNALTFGNPVLTSTRGDTTATQVAELGRVTRFASSLRLVSAERGNTRRQGGITRAGNGHRMPLEAACAVTRTAGTEGRSLAALPASAQHLKVAPMT